MPDSDPACPDGQECVNGQCVRPGHSIDINLDMGSNKGDLKGADMKGVDMAQPTGSGCGALAACYLNAATAADQNDCVAAASDSAISLLQAAFNCAISYCEDTAFACEDDGMGNPVDPFGGSGCDMCLTDSTAKLYPMSCSSSSSPDCNPSVCKSDVNACLAD